MTWLYVPGISSPCAQESEDSNSASCSPSIIGERLVEASATWRGKEQQPQAWSRRWKQGGFIRLLSGLTCSPSTLDHGVAQFISSLREIPAKTTALQERERERMESDSSPPKSAALPKSAGLILSSARTYRGTATDSLKPSSRHWKGWATALRQEYSVRPRPATPCGASDCSSWPSATVAQRRVNKSASANAAERPTLDIVAENWPGPMAGSAGTDDYNAAGNSDFSRRTMELADAMLIWATPKAITGGANSNREARGAGGPDLQEQAQHWMGPNVPNGGRSTAHAEQVGGTLYHEGKKVQLGLESQVKQWTAPLVADAGEKIALASHQNSLLKEAASFRPPSSPDQPIAGGSMSSTDSPNSNQPSVKRKLNPIFVEALMRWPTGLSGFERQAMAWTRWRLLMPSFLSQLCSASDVEDAQMDLFRGMAG